MLDQLSCDVKALRRRAHAFGVDAASWPEIVDQAARIKIGSAYVAASLTALAVDGTVASYEDVWTPQVTEALDHLGLTASWDPTSLHRTLSWINEREQLGLVSSLKGAMLELEVVDMVEHEALVLPHDADELRLASDLNQPGWDAELLSNGDNVGFVQIKATPDLGPIREHLSKYPELPDVITTTEAAEKAAHAGLATVDSGVLDAHLSALAEDAVDSLDLNSLLHEVVPGSAAAVILVMASLRWREGEDLRETARWARSELCLVEVAHLAGAVVEVATGAAVLRPITSVATRLTTRRIMTTAAAHSNLAELHSRLMNVTNGSMEAPALKT